MSYATNVYNLMMNSSLWQIVSASGTGAAASAGNSVLSVLPAGEPEHIPEITFIASQHSGGNSFIPDANNYHQTYDFNPTTIDSMEDLLTNLSSRTEKVKRMRLVTHANHDNLFIDLFSGTTRGIFKEQLEGFAISDIEGLKKTIEIYSNPTRNFLAPNDQTDDCLTALKANTASALALVPFGMDSDTHPPSATERLFIRRCIDLRLIDIVNITDLSSAAISTPNKNILKATTNIFISDLQSSIEGNPIHGSPSPGTIDNSHLTALKNQILNLSATDLGLNLITEIPFDPQAFSDLNGSNIAIGNNIRARITHAKTLFDSNSVIDIRGCRVGQSSDYLQAVSQFFGTNGNFPKVTGPEWFQSFPIAFRTFGNPQHIDDFFSTGDLNPTAPAPQDRGSISGTDVDNAFDEWRNLIDYNPIYDFYNDLFTGVIQDFASLQWQQNIPRLRMEAVRIEDMATLNLGEIIVRFREIYPPITIPNGTIRGRLNQLHLQIINFKQVASTVAATNNPNDDQLSTNYNSLKTIANGITSISGFSAPSATMVPASAPASLGENNIQDYITNIDTHINALLNSHLNTFFTSVQNEFNRANNRRYFYFYIGLPLFVQSSSTPMDYDILMWNPLRTQAFRSWMKAGWTGSSTEVNALHTHLDALNINWNNPNQRNRRIRTPRLNRERPEDNANTDAAFVPLSEFQQRIETHP